MKFALPWLPVAGLAGALGCAASAPSATVVDTGTADQSAMSDGELSDAGASTLDAPDVLDGSNDAGPCPPDGSTTLPTCDVSLQGTWCTLGFESSAVCVDGQWHGCGGGVGGGCRANVAPPEGTACCPYDYVPGIAGGGGGCCVGGHYTDCFRNRVQYSSITLCGPLDGGAPDASTIHVVCNAPDTGPPEDCTIGQGISVNYWVGSMGEHCSALQPPSVPCPVGTRCQIVAAPLGYVTNVYEGVCQCVTSSDCRTGETCSPDVSGGGTLCTPGSDASVDALADAGGQ